MAKYAWIVASNAKYIPGLNALINSLDSVGNKHDLHINGYKIPKKYIDAVNNAGFGYKIIWHEITQAEVDWLGEAEVLMRKRYFTPTEIDADVVCIMDADMFVCQNLDRYFTMASTGIILGCGLEQKRRYNETNHQYPAGSGIYLIPPEHWSQRDLCCSPLFISKKWFPVLKKTWDMVNNHPHGGERFRAPEMDALNICLIEAGAHEWTVPMNQPCWTGLHESLMKAHTRAVDIHGMLFTEDGQEVNVVHGQFWNVTWRKWQIEGQMGMIEREFDNSQRYKSISQGSFEFVCRWYKKFACEHKVNVNDFLGLIPSRDEATKTDVMELL